MQITLNLENTVKQDRCEDNIVVCWCEGIDLLAFVFVTFDAVWIA
jgi:hypothetical protein